MIYFDIVCYVFPFSIMIDAGHEWNANLRKILHIMRTVSVWLDDFYGYFHMTRIKIKL